VETLQLGLEVFMKPLPLIRFRIDFGENSNVGPGKIELLEAIQTHGSVSAAARILKLSYRRAWLLLDSLNQSFTEPVSVNSVGGNGGGGVKITPFGALLIERYREAERRFIQIGNECLRDIQARIVPSRSEKLTRVPLKKKRRQRVPEN
jgi:molybdate transport system regulatory protein